VHALLILTSLSPSKPCVVIYKQISEHSSPFCLLGRCPVLTSAASFCTNISRGFVNRLQAPCAGSFQASSLILRLQFCAHTVSVYSPPGDVTLGSTAGATALYVYGATTFESSSAPITANAALVANAGLTVSGTSVLGQTSSDLLTVNAAANFTAVQTVLFGNSSTAASSAVLQFQRRAAAAAVTNGTVLGEVQFTGWDGAADGLGSQIRSVFTVSLFSF